MDASLARHELINHLVNECGIEPETVNELTPEQLIEKYFVYDNVVTFYQLQVLINGAYNKIII